MIKDAENLLRVWGNWGRDHPGLLISSRSTIGRCMDEAEGASIMSVRPEIHMPRLVEIGEDIVLSMSTDIQDVMILKYVKKWYARDACRRIGVSSAHYYNLISYGIYYTAGCLKYHEKNLKITSNRVINTRYSRIATPT